MKVTPIRKLPETPPFRKHPAKYGRYVWTQEWYLDTDIKPDIQALQKSLEGRR